MYGKLFASMFRGSLYGKWQAIVTFQQMIILADKDGTVDFTPEALSATTSIPLDIIQEGIALLEAPDSSTRTPGEEGRRIIRTNPDRPWGWHIVNYGHYRAIRTAEERRAYHREYWHKNRKLNNSTNTQQTQPIAEAEAEAEADNYIVRLPPDVPPAGEQKPKNCFQQEALEILNFLNTKTGRSYQPVTVNLEMIIARLKEGYTRKQLVQVVARKHAEWGADEKMNIYLRPATLFNRTKCAQYVGELVAV